jgi:hypothetical protein
MTMSNSQQQASDNASSPTDKNQQHLHNLANEATATLSDVKEQGAEQYENLRDLATDQIDSLVEGAQSAAAALEGKDSVGLSQYLGQLASGLGSFADQVRDKSAEDLLHKGAQLARDNPALFLAGSVAIGFGLSRFLRASAGHGSQSPQATSSGSPPSPVAAPIPAAMTEEYFARPAATASTGAVTDPIGEAAIHPPISSPSRGI